MKNFHGETGRKLWTRKNKKSSINDSEIVHENKNLRMYIRSQHVSGYL